MVSSAQRGTAKMEIASVNLSQALMNANGIGTASTLNAIMAYAILFLLPVQASAWMQIFRNQPACPTAKVFSAVVRPTMSATKLMILDRTDATLELLCVLQDGVQIRIIAVLTEIARQTVIAPALLIRGVCLIAKQVRTSADAEAIAEAA